MADKERRLHAARAVDDTPPDQPQGSSAEGATFDVLGKIAELDRRVRVLEDILLGGIAEVVGQAASPEEQSRQ